MAQYDGWDRLDTAMVMSLVLFASVGLIWVRLFECLMRGELTERYHPVLLAALGGIAAILVLGDLAIFYAGLAAKASSSWTETPWYVAPLASVVYMAGLALLGAWHADWRQSGEV